MTDAVILSGARTPVGKFMGALKDFSAVDLGVIAARAAIERAGIDPAEVNEVIMGNVVQAGNGQNPARQVALGAGIPNAVSALTRRPAREGQAACAYCRSRFSAKNGSTISSNRWPILSVWVPS